MTGLKPSKTSAVITLTLPVAKRASSNVPMTIINAGTKGLVEDFID